jgi:6-phosphogluconolactonase/glucosamine-6-phosphate isomerase/deaminase
MNTVYATDAIAVQSSLIDTLRTHLASGHNVLWLLSGGSAIDSEVAIAHSLHDSDVSRLTISLIDERYGPIGHPHENWQQLIDAGFSIPGATVYRPLIGQSRPDTAQAFNSWIGNAFGQSDYSIALMGIGADGHTSGIKPHSPAATVSGWVTDYTSDDYQRVTTTFDAIMHLDEVVILALGESKFDAIRTLLHHDVPYIDQPAQVLKHVKKSTLYTDYREDTL